jgi:hypothetical protein
MGPWFPRLLQHSPIHVNLVYGSTMSLQELRETFFEEMWNGGILPRGVMEGQRSH